MMFVTIPPAVVLLSGRDEDVLFMQVSSTLLIPRNIHYAQADAFQIVRFLLARFLFFSSMQWTSDIRNLYVLINTIVDLFLAPETHVCH